MKRGYSVSNMTEILGRVFAAVIFKDHLVLIFMNGVSVE